MSQITSVKFRMYNTGSVGDCLLLLFMKGNTISFSMLVDCGGFQTTPALIQPCVKDIATTCNYNLDLLVLTHQHEDHVSGFNQARPLFDQITVQRVWMSWMENPADPIGKIVKEKYGKKIRAALAKATQVKGKLQQLSRQKFQAVGMKERFSRKAMRADAAEKLLLFELGESYMKKAAKGTRTNQDAIDYVRRKGKERKYWKPGEVAMDIPGAEGVRFFMLGPPRDADLKLFFTKTVREEEIYHLAATSKAAPLSAEEEEETMEKISGSIGTALSRNKSPFAAEYQLKGAELTTWWKNYNARDNRWRQIETDAEEGSLGIALRATKYTNNTSLAMAVELPDGQVILLPGDAQSGNWMGWHKPDVMNALKQKGGKTTVELLQQTTLYKVGHHSSENGTASISGMEHMNAENLVAMIPLIKSKVPSVWNPDGFPARALYRKLIEKTSGRVIRVDEGIAKSQSAANKRQTLSAKDRNHFKKNYNQGSCYQEYIMEIR